MEQETMKCPYCGEEILAVAKKCKHCGEWLDENESEEEYVAEENGSSESLVYVKEDDDAGWGWVFTKVLPVIIILAVAFFTMPSEEKQTEAMKEELRVLVRKDLKGQIHNEDAFTQAIGKSMMKDKDVVDELVRRRYAIKVNNYKIFSTITVKEKETGDTRTCGFAAFGFIHIFK